MSKPFVGLYMIVRDAEKTLPALLASVAGKESERSPFDEYVFVDTGSVDSTKEILASYRFGIGARVVLADFTWIDDFAAARNYAMSLTTASWVMYLDADDTFPDAPKLRKNLEHHEAKRPEVNAISLPYIYKRDDTHQEVIRVVRRAPRLENGAEVPDVAWYWEDEIHEHLRNAAGPRQIVHIGDLPVLHHKTADEMPKAYVRNTRIAEKAYDVAVAQGNTAKAARMAYYLAQSAKVQGRLDEAEHYLVQCVEHYRGTNLGVYAYTDLARIAIDRGDLEHAADIAAVSASRAPEYRETLTTLGTIHAMRGDWSRAVAAFDDAQRRAVTPIQSLEDVWWSRGLCMAHGAMAYLRVERDEDARRLLNEIPPGVIQNEAQVRAVADKVNTELFERQAMRRVQDLVSMLLWDTEAPKAIKLLEECVPANISHRPEIAAAIRDIRRRIQHLDSWEAYKEAYSSIPSETYHTAQHDRDATLSLERARRLLAWAHALPAEGERVRAAAIGFQDGIIESALLEANARIDLTVCDVAPQASQGLAELQEKFAGRVRSHAITRHTYDWCPDLEWEKFDAVTLFEVLEHVPYDAVAVANLNGMLKPGGRLFLSTPVARRWIEPHLTDAKLAPPVYWHVRAHNHVTLHALLEDWSFRANIVEAWDGTFVVEATKQAGTQLPRRRVSIYVPGTPQPFDALATEEGFLGGSEECVVHLAPELAKLGAQVTVYCPLKERDDGNIIRSWHGVLWRPVEEFDPLGDHGTVMFWRCPQLLLSPWVKEAQYKKVLWLHDCMYSHIGATPEAYARADSVVALSTAHAVALAKNDGAPGPFILAANGIKEEAFPEPDESQRDPHKVIYASSPDRGLRPLLEMWISVRDAVPEATLDIYYDWTAFRRLRPRDCADLEELVRMLEPHGVRYLGGVAQPVLHDAMRKASVWAYPCADAEVETFCITAVKAMACGLIPVTTMAGALPEVLGEEVTALTCPVDVDAKGIDSNQGRAKFKCKLVAALQGEAFEAEPALCTRTSLRELVRRRALEVFTWSVVARTHFMPLLSSR